MEGENKKEEYIVKDEEKGNVTEEEKRKMMDNNNNKEEDHDNEGETIKRVKKKAKKETNEEERKEYWQKKRKGQRERKKERAKSKREEKEKEREKNGEIIEKKPEKTESEKIRHSEIRKKKREEWLTKPKHGNFVIDLSFDDLMEPKETRSLALQIAYCYSSNKKMEKPINLELTSFNGKLEAALRSNEGFPQWKLPYHSEHFSKVFPHDKLVYLTSDSDNILKEIEQDKYYIIGGIVDKNRHKGITLQKAKELGIATAQLPIGEHIKLDSRKVLTVNQVMEMILHFIQTDSWGEAVEKALPQRKIPISQSELKEGEDEESHLSKEIVA